MRKESTTRRESSSMPTYFTSHKKALRLLSLLRLSTSWRRKGWRRLSVASSSLRKTSRVQSSGQTLCGSMAVSSTQTSTMISSRLLRYPSMPQTASCPLSQAKRRPCLSSSKVVLRAAAATTQSPPCSNPNHPSSPTTQPRSPSGTSTANSSN